jgi:hypothetical protein
MISPNSVVSGQVKYQEYQDYYYVWPETQSSVVIQASLKTSSKMDIPLRLSFVDAIPFTVSTLSGYSTYTINRPSKSYTRIRVSWGNDNGLTPRPSPQIADLKLIGSYASFNISTSNTIQVEPMDFDYFDIMIVLGVTFSLLISIFSLSRMVNRCRHRRRGSSLIALSETFGYPIPTLYSYLISCGVPMTETVELSIESFSSPKLKTDFQATSRIILMPGKDLYLNQGLIPEFAIGTHIDRVQTGETDKGKQKKILGISIPTIRKSNVME